jgi:serine/threonine-protein kinase
MMNSEDPTLPVVMDDSASVVSSGAPSSSFHAGLVKGTGPKLETETKALLRVRLRALTLVFLVIWGVFVFRNLLFLDRDVGNPLGLVVLSTLAILTAILYSPVKIPLRVLRLLEVAIIVLVVSDILLVMRFRILDLVEINQLASVEIRLQGATLAYVFVILLYGVFIPNTWKRAALVVTPVVVLPLLHNLVLTLQVPQIREFLGFEEVSSRVLVLVFAAAASVYGAYIIGSLRAKAFEARQLGQYQLVEKLGSGGMGEVWKAKHKMLARPAAIKLIRPERLGTDDAKTTRTLLHRFEREAQVTATLESPHSVLVYDFGTSEDGSFYYVMELLNGLDLEHLIRRYGPVSSARAVYFLGQACESLSDAHDRELIHRDIKPGNLFSCHFGRRYDFIKILDFGLVKTLDDSAAVGPQLTAVDAIAGTPSYMAPEQALGEPIDARTDIYALGCVAYWLVTGRLVFDSNSISAMMIDHAKTPPSPPSQRCDQSISPDLESLILRCLEKDPAKRPSSAGELQRELSKCQVMGQWGPEEAAQWWKTNVNE